MKKEKSVANTSSAPAAASQHSEGKDVLRGLTPNRPLSPRGSKTPRQETAVEACSTEEKQNAHTVTLTPQPEVSQWSAIKEERIDRTSTVSLSNSSSLFMSVGAVCWFD